MLVLAVTVVTCSWCIHCTSVYLSLVLSGAATYTSYVAGGVVLSDTAAKCTVRWCFDGMSILHIVLCPNGKLRTLT